MQKSLHTISGRFLLLFDGIVDFFAFLAGILLVFLIVIICFDVVIRYLTVTPLGWVIEICEYTLLYITFLGTTWLLREGGHVRVDIVINNASPDFRWGLSIFTSAMGMASTFLMFVYSSLSAWNHFCAWTLVIQTLNIPKWTLVVVIPIGSFLLFVQFVRNLVETVKCRTRDPFCAPKPREAIQSKDVVTAT